MVSEKFSMICLKAKKQFNELKQEKTRTSQQDLDQMLARIGREEFYQKAYLMKTIIQTLPISLTSEKQLLNKIKFYNLNKT